MVRQQLVADDKSSRCVVLPTLQGDLDHLTAEERTALVRAAAEAIGDRAMIAATVAPCEVSAGEQAEAYLKAGADAINLRYPTNDADAFRTAMADVVAAGADYVIVTDHKSGGFDMNMMGKGPRQPAGLPLDLVSELFAAYPQFKSLIVALPLNECGPKTSKLLAATDNKLNIITETATDQFLEHLYRGAEGFVTGAFVRIFTKICDLHAQGGEEAARPLFFDMLRAIVWTKQYVDREPWLYQNYLANKGIFAGVSFRTERYYDEYMIRYGMEMLALVDSIETKLDTY